MKISQKEIDAIMSLAKKIILERENTKELEILRKSEDEHDMTGRP